MLNRLAELTDKMEISQETKTVLNETKAALKGPDRRKFMAKVLNLFGKGGQRRAERELGWNRKTIQKGARELESGFVCVDNFSGRGRKCVEERLPGLLDDIKDIVEPTSQADPTFRTTQIYTPLTAGEVRRRLIEDKNYKDEDLPKERTILKKLNNLNYRPEKVKKCRPIKKTEITDAVFENVHATNKLADESDGVLRISMDAKASINVGPFSRGGHSRQKQQAVDHDFAPDAILKLFGIFLPAYDESYFFSPKAILLPILWSTRLKACGLGWKGVSDYTHLL